MSGCNMLEQEVTCPAATCLNRWQHMLLYICERKNYVFADLRKLCKSKIRSGPQIVNPQSVTFAEGSQIFGLAICGTYLRTAQLCRGHVPKLTNSKE